MDSTFTSESHLTFDPHLGSERGGRLLSRPPPHRLSQQGPCVVMVTCLAPFRQLGTRMGEDIADWGWVGLAPPQNFALRAPVLRGWGVVPSL